VGISRTITLITRDQVGVDWYAKPVVGPRFGTGKAIPVAPGEDTLTKAFVPAQDGDELVLVAGDYLVNKVLPLDRAITIKGPQDGTAQILFARHSLIEIREGGSIRLANVSIDGAAAPDNVGNALIRTTTYPIQSNFVIEFAGVSVTNLDVNRSFHVIVLGKNTFADRVSITNSRFANITGSILLAAAETEDYGQYNVEYVDILNSQFSDIGAAAFDIYRGGRDESTFGPHFTMANTQFSNVGTNNRSAQKASIVLHGAQQTDITASQFIGSAPIAIIHTVGRPATQVSNNEFAGTPAPVVDELVFEGEPRAIIRDNVMTDADKTP